MEGPISNAREVRAPGQIERLECLAVREGPLINAREVLAPVQV